MEKKIKEESKHSWAFPETKPDTSRYGMELATKVAEALEKKKRLLMGEHREYCGTGLTFRDGKYCFCYVIDGCPFDGHTDKCLRFANKTNFVAWLSSKSNFQMGGFDITDKDLYESDTFMRGNQRIMKENLMEFIKK